jgi:hypothetical protein
VPPGEAGVEDGYITVVDMFPRHAVPGQHGPPTGGPDYGGL